MSQEMKLDEFEEGQPRIALGSPEPLSAAPDFLDGSAETALHSRMRVLARRRRVVIVITLVVLQAVAAYTFTVTPIYEARAQLLIESEAPNVVSFRGVVDQESATTDYYQTQYRLLQSRGLASKTLDRLSLWSHSAFIGDGASDSLMSALQSMTAGAAGGARPDATAADTTGKSLEASRAPVVDRFLGSLSIVPARGSRMVDVRFRSPDPAVASRIANTLVAVYVEQNLEHRFTASKEAADWLAERLAEQRQKVEDSEIALQRYRETNDAISLEDRQNIVVQKLADLNSAVTQAKTDRLHKQALYEQLQRIQSDRTALDTVPAVLTSVFVQSLKSEIATLERRQAQLSETLGDKHPEMAKIATSLEAAENRLQGEVAKIVQGVHNEYRAALAQETSLVQALNAQTGEAQGLNRKAIDYGVLQRDAQSNREIYNSLLQRAKETGVSGELKTSNIRIVDPAEVPRSPVSPRRNLNLAFGLLLGLGLGVGVAFFFDYLDNRIKNPEEIKHLLGIPSLALIPAVTMPDDKRALITESVPPGYREAFGSLRTNVVFSTPASANRILTVTSTGPKEGKTSVASNLAIALAQLDQRVLLVDADLRRPSIHGAFDQPQEPGLSNLIAGTCKASESVQKTHVPGLWVLPAGRIPPNPAELLGSRRMRDFLSSVGKHFEWVIIDTPPILAVTDAAMVGNLSTGTIFVVGSEMTSRHAATAALEQLKAANVRVIGGVLNKVALEKHAYYYGKYYRREYAQYYVRT